MNARTLLLLAVVPSLILVLSVPAPAQQLSLLAVESQTSGQGEVLSAATPPAASVARPARYVPPDLGIKTAADLHKGLPRSIRISGAADRKMRLTLYCWYAATNRWYPGYSDEGLVTPAGFGWKPFEKTVELKVPVSAAGRYSIDLELQKSGSLGTKYVLTRAKLLVSLPGCAPDQIYLSTAPSSRDWLIDVASVSVQRRESGVVVGPQVKMTATLKDGSTSTWNDYGICREPSKTAYPMDLVMAN